MAEGRTSSAIATSPVVSEGPHIVEVGDRTVPDAFYRTEMHLCGKTSNGGGHRRDESSVKPDRDDLGNRYVATASNPSARAAAASETVRPARPCVQGWCRGDLYRAAPSGGCPPPVGSTCGAGQQLDAAPTAVLVATCAANPGPAWRSVRWSHSPAPQPAARRTNRSSPTSPATARVLTALACSGVRWTTGAPAGRRPTGDLSTGNRSTGDPDTGDRDTGDLSTIDQGADDRGTGDPSIGQLSTGGRAARAGAGHPTAAHAAAARCSGGSRPCSVPPTTKVTRQSLQASVPAMMQSSQLMVRLVGRSVAMAAASQGGVTLVPEGSPGRGQF